MKKIAFLTSTSAPKNPDDELAANALLSSNQYSVDFIPWDKSTEWSVYDFAVIRSTWDYTLRIEKFLTTLRAIEASGVKLLNSSTTVKWNHHKGYLKELEQKGVHIVPTLFFKDSDEICLNPEWSESRLILKPCISASARDTFIISKQELTTGSYKSKLHKADWMLQPFLENITQGEISLHYFARKFSHAVIKVPKPGDFRVQEEHGGIFSSYSASKDLRLLGENILGLISEPLLYARVDLIPHNNSYALMELELIEPFLNFKMHPLAAQNFAQALDTF